MSSVAFCLSWEVGLRQVSLSQTNTCFFLSPYVPSLYQSLCLRLQITNLYFFVRVSTSLASTVVQSCPGLYGCKMGSCQSVYEHTTVISEHTLTCSRCRTPPWKPCVYFFHILSFRWIWALIAEGDWIVEFPEVHSQNCTANVIMLCQSFPHFFFLSVKVAVECVTSVNQNRCDCIRVTKT